MRNLMLLIVGFAPFVASACDWKIASDTVDPMSDERRCLISSTSAKIGIVVAGKRVLFVTTSAYKGGRDHLTLRVDEQPAIILDPQRDISTPTSPTNTALAQIRAGARLRTAYSDYPTNQQGEAAICNLPQLIDSCSAP